MLISEFMLTTKIEEPSAENMRNLFQCDNLEYIQLSNVCDGNVDCVDKADERNCCK